MSIRLVLTCDACPEQYDAFYGDQMVGYLRLRHGRFIVNCPDIGGDLVYSASPDGDGAFNDDEREKYLQSAVKAIQQWMREHNKMTKKDCGE
jgi:hypothetical protein